MAQIPDHLMASLNKIEANEEEFMDWLLAGEEGVRNSQSSDKFSAKSDGQYFLRFESYTILCKGFKKIEKNKKTNRKVILSSSTNHFP